MYSVVLMMALSGGAEGPECHNRCCGCTGAYYGNNARYGGGGCYGGYGGGGCYGGYGGYGCYGYATSVGALGCHGAVVMPPPPMNKAPEVVPPPMKEKAPMKGASIKVNLPADAVLKVDGYTTSSTSANRTFATPPLDPGVVFSYTLQAEFVENGQRRVETQVVPVRAGQESVVRFGAPAGNLSARR